MSKGADATGRASAVSTRWATWITVAVAVVGCGTTGGGLEPDSPAALKEKVVAERASARWQALIKRDYEGAYTYFSAASRDATTLEKYVSKIGAVQYRAATVQKVECSAEVCKATVSVTYDFPPAKARGVTTLLDESWIIDRGNAWFVFRG